MARGKISNKLIKIVELLKKEGELYISEIYNKLGLRQGYQAVMSLYLILLALYGVIKYRRVGIVIMVRLSENYEENLNRLIKDIREKTWME